MALLPTFPGSGWGSAESLWVQGFSESLRDSFIRKELKTDALWAARANPRTVGVMGTAPRRCPGALAGPGGSLLPRWVCAGGWRGTCPSSRGDRGSQDLLGAALCSARWRGAQSHLCRHPSPREARGLGDDRFVHLQICLSPCSAPLYPPGARMQPSAGRRPGKPRLPKLGRTGTATGGTRKRRCSPWEEQVRRGGGLRVRRGSG